ncbi:MAG: hypothetical protein BGP13_04120 [Sphingobacteriales bacterium 40-81]|nr:MAG: hypothetical protein BGP13_04120 [Sphingobacteriales bacterium 40-81]
MQQSVYIIFAAYLVASPLPAGSYAVYARRYFSKENSWAARVQLTLIFIATGKIIGSKPQSGVILTQRIYVSIFRCAAPENEISTIMLQTCLPAGRYYRCAAAM